MALFSRSLAYNVSGLVYQRKNLLFCHYLSVSEFDAKLVKFCDFIGKGGENAAEKVFDEDKKTVDSFQTRISSNCICIKFQETFYPLGFHNRLRRKSK